MTKVISIMTQKGGVGKSSLTNSVVLDWCFKELLRTKAMPKVLLIDADVQASISILRVNDMTLCRLDPEGKDYRALDSSTQSAVSEMRTQFAVLHKYKNWQAYNIFPINSDSDGNIVPDDGAKLRRAIDIIEGRGDIEYDYIFVDMPGTMYQGNTAELFSYVNYLVIPTVISNYGVQSTLDFCTLLQDSGLGADKEIRLMFNMYELLKRVKFDEVERELTVNVKIPFFKTRVKMTSYFPSKNYNSLVPPTFRINLNTSEVSATPKVTNIGDFTDELRRWVISGE